MENLVGAKSTWIGVSLWWRFEVEGSGCESCTPLFGSVNLCWFDFSERYINEEIV